MEHFEKIRSQLEANGLDGILLTEEHNRLYASGFASPGTDGAALVTKKGSYYFTDNRYTVAVEREVENAAIAITGPGRGYVELINEVIELEGIKVLGFDDAAMTVADFRRYEAKLNCELKGASDIVVKLREVKDEEELKQSGCPGSAHKRWR